MIDAVHVRIRDGQVADRAVYVVIAVDTDGCRQILGIRAGDGGEGAEILVTTLADGAAVEAAMTGPEGALRTLSTGRGMDSDGILASGRRNCASGCSRCSTSSAVGHRGWAGSATAAG
ncbi:transposase [Streptomyces sp. KK5PA1]|uniref:Transposase n=1 Tax=Actinacidiphila acididurans TaxID=2784346 RepID=A0ABS2TIH7_9ACTN|nr:transposase [Actinacidiphila acididurans]